MEVTGGYEMGRGIGYDRVLGDRVWLGRGRG